MEREPLRRASDELREASELTDGTLGERLLKQSETFADLAGRDRGPDHGRLDRHLNALREIAAQLDGEAKAHVEAASEAVTEYRSGVSGV
ncbi:DUF7553 family protein [Haloprofundus halophilus]|uniref:DUF7553 family protein n=1 Tax=Haloprofundus halophilus TaxID=2283527 RepID=UPI000E4302C0|nr:hypothetical protein [Haloprofundus halophilus]